MAKDFVLMRQGPKLNNFYKIKLKYPTKDSGYSNEAEYIIPNIIEMRIEDKTMLTPTVRRFLDILSIQLTANNCNKNIVYIPIGKYMDWVGSKSHRNAKQHLSKDMDALDSIQFKFIARNEIIAKEKDITKKKQSPDGHLIGKGFVRVSGGPRGFIKDTAFFTLSEPFYNLLRNYYVMNFNIYALRLEVDKYPNAYFISRFLDLNFNMNRYKDSLSSVKVSTLLQECPQIPPLECIGRKWRERIIRPFFRDLNAVGINYRIFDGNKRELSKDDVADTISLDDFLKAKLIFDYTEHIEKISDTLLRPAN